MHAVKAEVYLLLGKSTDYRTTLIISALFSWIKSITLFIRLVWWVQLNGVPLFIVDILNLPNF